MKAPRLARVAEVVREVASETILFELRDPRVKLVTVTRAEVSGDLQHAKVYVSVMGTPKEQELCMHGQPSVVENSYNLLDRDDERHVIPLCADLEIPYMAFGPLAGGLLTGRYRQGEEAPPGSRLATRPEGYEHLLTGKTFAALDRFTATAEEHEVTPATLALAWVLARPHVTSVIIGARNQEQIGVALRALDVRLSSAEADVLTQLF